MLNQTPDTAESTLSERLEQALLAVDRAAASRIMQRAAAVLEPAEIADRVVSPALLAIGDGWEARHVALSQVFMAGRIVEALTGELGTFNRPTCSPLRLGIGVLGDRHTLGKRIVFATLRCGGYPAVDLGSGLTPAAMAEAAIAADLDVLMVSVLMLNKALAVSEVLAELAARGRAGMPVVVGGAPFTQDPELWQRVGASAMGRSAGDALRIAAEYEEALT